MEVYHTQKPRWFLRAAYIFIGGLVGYWLISLPFQGGLEQQQPAQHTQSVQDTTPPFITILNNIYRERLQEHILSNSCMDLLTASSKQHELCNHQHELQSLRLQLARDKIERMYYFEASFDGADVDVLALFQEQVRQLSQNGSTNSGRITQPVEE